VLVGLDTMPRAFLMYRQFIQWVGGLGVIIFLVAIAPDLNVGGMRLFKMEVPGPMKEDKVVPRATNAARYLWGVYALLTILCALSYYAAGMGAFDAVAHSLTTLSTGGFSPYDASIGAFHSPAIEWVSIVFMLAGAINFALHLGVVRRQRIKAYWSDEETRSFLLISATGSLLVAWQIWHGATGAADALRSGVFHAVSFMTSTGYVSGDVAGFPLALGFTLIVLSYVGGCSGSTAGGTKVVRIVITAKALAAEFRQILHPHAIITTKYQGQTVPVDIFRSVFGFLFFYLAMSVLMIGILMLDGVDPWTALSAISATINCAGPAFGTLSSNFIPLSDLSTMTLSVAMLLGRMELMTILVLFTPVLWRA
jgi:trk system potassium uptake protein TrkH